MGTQIGNTPQLDEPNALVTESIEETSHASDAFVESSSWSEDTGAGEF